MKISLSEIILFQNYITNSKKNVTSIFGHDCNLASNQISNLKPNIMKKLLQHTAIYTLILLVFTSCEVIEGIFKAGMGVGIFIVIAVIAVIIWIISRFGKK